MYRQPSVRKLFSFKTCVLRYVSDLVVYVLLLGQASWLCSLCVYDSMHTANCIHSLILKSAVGGFQALWHSFPSHSQVQVGPLSAVPRHCLVPSPSVTLTPTQRHTDCWRRTNTSLVWLNLSLKEEEEIIADIQEFRGESQCCPPLAHQGGGMSRVQQQSEKQTFFTRACHFISLTPELWLCGLLLGVKGPQIVTRERD